MQPWASLLVNGIKRIEGRSWPTQHRGRLWIHATSQQPSDSDIQAGGRGSVLLRLGIITRDDGGSCV
jgi:ASCH domain